MSRTWQTEEMAMNRKKSVEDTQTLSKSLTKQMTRRGIPTRPAKRSETASEARNILVSVLSDFFLWIKKITRPLTATISRHMKDKRTINGEGRGEASSSPSVLLLEPLIPTQLELHVLSDDIS